MTGNESAFPAFNIQKDANSEAFVGISEGGLTKLELISALIAQGILANEELRKNVCANDGTVGQEAIKQAQALLKELEKTNKQEK